MGTMIDYYLKAKHLDSRTREHVPRTGDEVELTASGKSIASTYRVIRVVWLEHRGHNGEPYSDSIVEIYLEQV